MKSSWDIKLSPWVIADGNYGDFVRGQRAEFALEFWSEALTNSPRCERVCVMNGDSYDVTAEVIASLEDAWVIDFGLRAYRDEAPMLASRAGDFVSGSLSIGVDPFFYFERLCERTEIPPLVYSWEIASITMVTTPLVPVRAGLLRRRWIPDESKRQEQEVEGTDCPSPPDFTYVQEGKGLRPSHNLWFRLRCELLDVPPKRNSMTAKWHSNRSTTR